MKKRVVVYGLGGIFRADYDAIHEKYEVVGYCDRDEKKLAAISGLQINRDHLKEALTKCDFLLLSMSDNRMDIAQDLFVNYSISPEKMWFFRHIGEGENKDIIKPGMEFYGQFGDDAILLVLLRCLHFNPRNIRYLEIGTNDPVLSNNTFFFYSIGAHGVIIDPLPLIESFARRMRPRDHFIRAAVSDVGNETQTFLMSPATQGSSLYDGYAGSIATKISVAVLGINDVLRDIGFVPDVFVVDAEGEDEKIVKGIDFTKYRPAILEIEVNKAEKDGEVLKKFLHNKGYVLFTRIGSNAIYVDKSAWYNADLDSVNHFLSNV